MLREGNLEGASKIRYESIPELEKKLEAVAAQEKADLEPLVGEEVGAEQVAEVVEAWTGIPTGRMLEGETAKLLHMEEVLGERLIGQRSAVGAVERRRTPLARRHLRPEPADRLVPVPRPHRRGQDRAGQGAGGLPLRRRARDGAHRHERVRGEALRPRLVGAPPATWATKRAASSPRRCGGSRTACAAGRGREGPPGRLQHPAAGARRRTADRRPGPHRRLPQHRADPDQQPRARNSWSTRPSTRRRSATR